ncbi:hypothetical protein OEZ85_005160 [Tetradesmus obliquus]|uniref:Uncharacterized protein n=1 Tax=Tetradesmus obliquus TaxID=3088 RepID=A0ABY8UHH1_TETOB|nr:hypothetical protein OEZ85_005160 [Tetradesmus obliquus]
MESPKRVTFMPHTAAGARKFTEDIGLSSDGKAVVGEDGNLGIEVNHQGVPQVITMSDVFAKSVQHPLSAVQGLGRNSCVPGVALAAPDGCSSAWRASATGVVKAVLEQFKPEHFTDGSSMLRDNKMDPFVLLVPESVAAAQYLCRHLEGETCVLIIDVGHSTMAACLMIYRPGRLPTVIVRFSNSFWGAQDTEHALLGWVAELQNRAVLRGIINVMESAAPVQQGINLGIHVQSMLRQTIENASQVDQNDEDQVVSPVDEFLDEHLPEGITLRVVKECSQPQAEAAQQIVGAAIEVGKQCKKTPTMVYLTGGGGLNRSVRNGIEQLVAAELGPDVRVICGEGGNSTAVAWGAAALGSACWPSLAEVGGQDPPGHNLPAANALPSLFQGCAGYHYAALYSYSSRIVDGMTQDQLLDFSSRVHPAAKLESGEPDVEQRKKDQRKILNHINYKLYEARKDPALRKRRPEAPTGVPFFYSLVLPREQLPVSGRPLPWQMHTAPGSSSLPLEVVKIDVQFKHDAVVVGSWKMQNPGPGQYVSASVTVDLDGQLACEAQLRSVNDPDTFAGQSLQVDTDSDAYAAQRRDAERKLPRLPPLAVEFKARVSGKHALAAAAATAAAALPPPAAGAALFQPPPPAAAAGPPPPPPAAAAPPPPPPPPRPPAAAPPPPPPPRPPAAAAPPPPPRPPAAAAAAAAPAYQGATLTNLLQQAGVQHAAAQAPDGNGSGGNAPQVSHKKRSSSSNAKDAVKKAKPRPTRWDR